MKDNRLLSREIGFKLLRSSEEKIKDLEKNINHNMLLPESLIDKLDDLPQQYRFELMQKSLDQKKYSDELVKQYQIRSSALLLISNSTLTQNDVDCYKTTKEIVTGIYEQISEFIDEVIKTNDELSKELSSLGLHFH